MSTEHEGLRARYNAHRRIYGIYKERDEMLKQIVKKNSKYKRLNTILDLGAKL